MTAQPVAAEDGLIDKLVQDCLHHPMGWHESLKQLEDLARGNFEWLSIQTLEDERLRTWWPRLTDEAREAAKQAFWKKFESDPGFRVTVGNLMRDRGEQFP